MKNIYFLPILSALLTVPTLLNAMEAALTASAQQAKQSLAFGFFTLNEPELANGLKLQEAYDAVKKAKNVGLFDCYIKRNRDEAYKMLFKFAAFVGDEAMMDIVHESSGVDLEGTAVQIAAMALSMGNGKLYVKMHSYYLTNKQILGLIL